MKYLARNCKKYYIEYQIMRKSAFRLPKWELEEKCRVEL